MSTAGGPTSSDLPEPLLTDRIVGHAVTLDVYHWHVDGTGTVCCGGYLRAQGSRIWLSPDHAANLAQRLRAAIDNVVLGAPAAWRVAEQ